VNTVSAKGVSTSPLVITCFSFPMTLLFTCIPSLTLIQSKQSFQPDCTVQSSHTVRTNLKYQSMFFIQITHRIGVFAQ